MGMQELRQIQMAPTHQQTNPIPGRRRSSDVWTLAMSDHHSGFQHSTTLLLRLVAHRDHRSRPGAADDAQVAVDAAAIAPEDHESPGDRAERTQALSPPLPAGFNPYFDLPPV